MRLLSSVPREDLLAGAVDIALQHHERIDDGLGARRTAGNIHVDRQNFVDTGDHAVIIVKTAGRGAGPESYDPFGLSHLFVDAQKHGGELMIYGPHHKQQIRLAGRKTRQRGAETISVIMRAGNGHKLHTAAGGHKRVGEDGIFADEAGHGFKCGMKESALVCFGCNHELLCRGRPRGNRTEL